MIKSHLYTYVCFHQTSLLSFVCLCVCVPMWVFLMHACPCVCVCVCGTDLALIKPQSLERIISPSPDSNMLCIYGGNKLICNRQTDNWLKLLCPCIYLPELGRKRREESNIFRDGATCCAAHHVHYHPANFDLVLTFVCFSI